MSRVRPTRLTGLTAAGAAAGLLLGAAVTGAAADAPRTTLREAFARSGRDIGVALAVPRLQDPVYAEIAGREFAMVTPESALQFDATEPTRGTFTFAQAETLVDFATAHDMRVRGQSLLWHPGLPGWLTGLSGATLRAAMNDHVRQVAAHFAGRIRAWDVVNEAFTETGGRRMSLFQSTGGDWIEDAFRTAHAADPAATLCYNDFSIEDWASPKTQAVYSLVKDFRARGVPIGCIGVQSHFSPDNPVPASFTTTLRAFADLGVDVQLTQLDVAGSGAQQAADYGSVVTSCLSVPRCTGITVWGVRDTDSWRSAMTPLLFDGSGQPKPAYAAVVAAAVAAPTTSVPPATTSPTVATSSTTSAGTCTAAVATGPSHDGYRVLDVTVSGSPAWVVTVRMPPAEQVVSTWNAQVTWNAARTVLTARPAGGPTWGMLVRATGAWTSPVMTCRAGH